LPAVLASLVPLFIWLTLSRLGTSSSSSCQTSRQGVLAQGKLSARVYHLKEIPTARSSRRKGMRRQTGPYGPREETSRRGEEEGSQITTTQMVVKPALADRLDCLVVSLKP
jgi:hypothetical protein